MQGWAAADVFIDTGLTIKAVILPFAQRQAFTPSPLSGGPFVSGRIPSDSSRLLILKKHAIIDALHRHSFGFPDAFPDLFRPDIDSIIIINQMNTHNIRP